MIQDNSTILHENQFEEKESQSLFKEQNKIQLLQAMQQDIASYFNQQTNPSTLPVLNPASITGSQLKIHAHKVFEDKQDPLKTKPFKQWECIGNLHNPNGCASSVSGEGKITNPLIVKHLCEKKCATVQVCSQCVRELSDAAVLPESIDHPLHPKHPLIRSFNLTEQWVCDAKDYLGCMSNIPTMNGVKDMERYGCKQCNFDLCLRCVYYYIENPQIMTLYQVTSSLHSHPMTRWFDDNGWCCDGKKKEGGCASGFTGFHQTYNMNRWRCVDCDFDLCEKCLQTTMTDACPFTTPPNRDSFSTMPL